MHEKTLVANQSQNSPVAVANEVMPVQDRLETEVELIQRLPIQLKLSVGAPDDPLEYEADAMADKVMRMSETSFIQRKSARSCGDYDDEHVRLKPLASQITPFIQAKGNGAGAVSEAVSGKIQSSMGGGSPMQADTKSFMESRFGADFSDVKIHNGGESAELNTSLNAKAFTVNNNIYFNSGQYQPETDSGRHLLAHELTHVVQQGKGLSNSAQRAIELRRPGRGEASAFERAQEIIDRLNRLSTALQYQLVGNDLLCNVVDESAMTNFDTQMKGFIDLKVMVPLRLVPSTRQVIGDSFMEGYLDLDDLMASDDLGFQSLLLHILAERFSVNRYTQRIGTDGLSPIILAPPYRPPYQPNPEFTRAHGRGHQAQTEHFREVFSDPSIEFNYEEAKSWGDAHLAFKSRTGHYRIFLIMHHAVKTPTSPVRATTEGTIKVMTADGQWHTVEEFLQSRAAAAAPPVQPKLEISQPGDRYEEEADTMADKVMRMPETKFIQRKAGHSCGDYDDEHIRLKPLASQITPFIQAKGNGAGAVSDAELTHAVQQGNAVQRKIIQRKVNPDEGRIYTDEGLKYENAIKQNLDNWQLLYKFYNIFLKKNIFPGSQPNAYANHVFKIQQYFITNYPKQFASHQADGILDTLTLTYLLELSKDVEKIKSNLSDYDGLDIEVLERLATIRPTKNPPLQSSFLKDVGQFKLVNDFGFAIEIGSKGNYVNVLQQALVFLHYDISGDELNKKFGKETEEALKNFQRDAGVPEKDVDGRLGQHTLRLLDNLLAGKGSVLVLPGMTSFVKGPLNNGLELFVDGDGDQRKELKLKFTVKSNKLVVFVTHIDTKETKGPFAFSFDNLNLADDVSIIQTAATEGLIASKIEFTNPSKGDKVAADTQKNIIEIYPPGQIGKDGKYELKNDKEDYTTSFDISKAKINTVVSSGISVQPTTISADITLGYYGDKFRFTIIKGDSGADKDADENGNGGAYNYLLKIAGMGNNGDAVFSNDIPFVLPEQELDKLVFNDVEKDATSVTYDFNGDGNRDIKINTIVRQLFDNRQEGLSIPKTGRNITIVLTGAALKARVEKYFSVVNGKFQFIELKTAQVFEDVIAAEGGNVLKEQQVPSSIEKEIEGLDNVLDEFYQQAATDNTINKETYVAYRVLKAGLKSLSPVMAKKETDLTEDDKKQINELSLYADLFYDLLKKETKDARKETDSTATEASSTDTETNPFTHESTTTTIVPFNSPSVRTYELAFGNELRQHKWTSAIRSFAQLRQGYNLWITEQVKAKNPDKPVADQIAAYFKYQSGLEEITNDKNNKYITRVRAIYYSWDQFTKEPGVKHIELPMYYYLNEDDGKWWIIDFVRPDHPFKRKESVDDTNKNIVRNDGKTPAPPQALFDKLNDKEHLPKGVLLYDAGEGIHGRIEMTEPWEWKDILGWIGLGLAAVGLAALVVLSDGLATPVAAEVFFALSAVAGGTAAAMDIYKMYKDEEWSAKRVAMDVGQIAASILSLGMLGTGKLVVVAREADPAARLTGGFAKLASLADRLYVPLIKTTIGTDVINFALIGKDTLDKLSEIDKQPGDAATKTRSKIFLISQLLFAGGMTFLSLRGNVRGLENGPTLILHPGPDGVPMVSDARVWLSENIHSADLFEKITALAKQRKFPLNAAADKMYNIDNLIQGLQNAEFGESKYAVKAVETLLNNGDDFEKTAQAIAYSQKKEMDQKVRFKYFDVIYEGIVLGKTRAFPRGFASQDDFKTFSQKVRGLAGEFGDDIRIQGSATIELPTKLPDIDIGIFLSEEEFFQAMKKSFGHLHYTYKNGPSKTGVPDGYVNSLSDSDFRDFLNEVIKNPRGTTAAGRPINAEMRTMENAFRTGKIDDSRATKSNGVSLSTVRAGLEKDLGMKVDLSIIGKNKSFEVGPFIQLEK